MADEDNIKNAIKYKITKYSEDNLILTEEINNQWKGNRDIDLTDDIIII